MLTIAKFLVGFYYNLTPCVTDPDKGHMTILGMRSSRLPPRTSSMSFVLRVECDVETTLNAKPMGWKESCSVC